MTFHRLGSSIHPNWRSHIFQRGRYINHQPVMEPWNFMTFHILGIIIPTDELIFFRGVGQPPTNQDWLWILLWLWGGDSQKTSGRVAFCGQQLGRRQKMERVTRSIYLLDHISASVCFTENMMITRYFVGFWASQFWDNPWHSHIYPFGSSRALGSTTGVWWLFGGEPPYLLNLLRQWPWIHRDNPTTLWIWTYYPLVN